jgi:hypothetical protein
MKTRTLILLVALATIFPSLTYSQGYILRRAVNRAVDKSVDAAVDKEIEENKDKKAKEKEEADAKAKAEQEKQAQQAGKTGQQSETQSGNANQGAQPSGGMPTGGIFGGKVTLKYNDEYSFGSRMYSQMETYDKKDVVKMDYYMYFSNNSPTAGVETKTINTSEGQAPVVSQVIIDGENKCFIMLTDVNGSKMGIISEIPSEAGQEKSPAVTKTGNSKTINGYKCDEYLFKPVADSKEYWKMWFTKDAVIKIDKHAWSQSGMPALYQHPDFKDGLVMAWESYDKNNKLTGKSEVKEINNNFSHSMSVKGYSLRQMDLSKQKKN